MRHPWTAAAQYFLHFSALSLTCVACVGADSAAAVVPASLQIEQGIIDGIKSTEKDYPATGAILFVTQREDGSKFGSMMCSATLIRRDVIMAAGHCDLSLFIDTDKPIDYYFSLSLDVSEFGMHSVKLPPQTVKIVKRVPHPKFDINGVELGLGKAHDIALMYLEKPITHVKPARLLRASEKPQLVADAEVEIVGYGRRHERSRRKTDAGIKYQGATHITEVGHYEMQISSGAPEPHKCHGDSGGPTYMPLTQGPRKGESVLIGVTSHAYDHADCQHGGVDTRIDPYLRWIRVTLKAACDNGERPGCVQRAHLTEAVAAVAAAADPLLQIEANDDAETRAQASSDLVTSADADADVDADAEL
jgi:hypothetical protein